MAKIGFIGTGIMGEPMAANLQKAGHQLFLSEHHGKAPQALIDAGAVALANPQQVAQEAEFIIVMVPDTPQVDDVLFRKDGVAAGLSPNKVVIDMSSISPTATKTFAAKINETGARYLFHIGDAEGRCIVRSTRAGRVVPSERWLVLGRRI